MHIELIKITASVLENQSINKQ